MGSTKFDHVPQTFFFAMFAENAVVMVGDSEKMC